MVKVKRHALLPIFFTVFLDLLGLGIVIPIFPTVIFDPIGGILPLSYSYSFRILLYGLLSAAYPIAQFFGAPILGELADAKGRKKLLLLSLIGTVCGYIIFTIGIIEGKLILLFLGRVIDGFTGGNISIAQAAIADISEGKSKVRNFGFVGMAFGLGFVIGPYIGGKFSDPSVLDWFTYATPFLLSITLTIINIFLVIFMFPETLFERRAANISIFSGFRNIIRAFSYKKLRNMFVVIILLSMGHNFFTKFLQVFLMIKFNYTQSQIGDFYGYMGLWVAFSQGVILRSLSRRYEPSAILSVSTVAAAFFILFILVPKRSFWLYIIIPFIAILQGMNQPNTSTIISNLAGEDKQGEILGINQSMQAVAQAVPPLVAGFISLTNINLPTIFSAASTMAAWAVFVLFNAGKNIKRGTY